MPEKTYAERTGQWSHDRAAYAAQTALHAALASSVGQVGSMALVSALSSVALCGSDTEAVSHKSARVYTCMHYATKE